MVTRRTNLGRNWKYGFESKVQNLLSFGKSYEKLHKKLNKQTNKK